MNGNDNGYMSAGQAIGTLVALGLFLLAMFGERGLAVLDALAARLLGV